MNLLRRSGSIETIAEELRSSGAILQRVADLLASVVGAHAAALERLLELADDPSVIEDDPALAEVLWVHRPLEAGGAQVDRYGTRIESLLDAIEQSATPPVAELAASLTREVTELYGEAIERAFELLDAGGQGAAIRAALDDDLVSSLLVVHGLHPRDLPTRVERCLAELVETIPEHGGFVELLDVGDDGFVRVQITGGSEIHRWRTRLAIERAIERAAPDHGGIEVLGARNEPAPVQLVTYIPLDSIRRASPSRVPQRWIDVPELAEVGRGEVRRLRADGAVALVACNIAGDLYVAADPFGAVNGVELVGEQPPTVEAANGERFVFDAPYPVQRTDDTVEVKVP